MCSNSRPSLHAIRPAWGNKRIKAFRSYEPDQILLMPPSRGDWVPEDQLARFVGDLVHTLELPAIEDAYTEEQRYPS